MPVQLAGQHRGAQHLADGLHGQLRLLELVEAALAPCQVLLRRDRRGLDHGEDDAEDGGHDHHLHQRESLVATHEPQPVAHAGHHPTTRAAVLAGVVGSRIPVDGQGPPADVLPLTWIVQEPAGREVIKVPVESVMPSVSGFSVVTQPVGDAGTATTVMFGWTTPGRVGHCRP